MVFSIGVKDLGKHVWNLIIVLGKEMPFASKKAPYIQVGVDVCRRPQIQTAFGVML
jgi:hypothetical protein